jgi:hypothetical protein
MDVPPPAVFKNPSVEPTTNGNVYSTFALPISVKTTKEAVRELNEADAHEADLATKELVAHNDWVAQTLCVE